MSAKVLSVTESCIDWMRVAVPSDCAYTWSIEMPMPTAGLVPWRQVVIAGGPQPCEPIELHVGVLSTFISTRTLSLMAVKGISVALGVYAVPKVVTSQVGCQTPQPMCQVTQRTGVLAAWASALVGLSSESSAGSVMAAAVPRSTVRLVN